MVTGLEVLGAVATCEGLAKDIYTLLQKLHGAGDAIINLRMRFETDVYTLSRILGFFKKWHNELPEKEAEHFQRLFEHLETRLTGMNRKVQKRIGIEQASSASPNISSKVKWALHGDSLERDEADLFEWGQRLESMLLFLPSKLKTDLLLVGESSPSPGGVSKGSVELVGVQAQNDMQKLARFFRAQQTILQVATEDDETIVPRNLVELDLPLSSSWATARLKGKGRVFVDLIRVPKAVFEQPSQLAAAKVEVWRLTQVLRLAHPARMHIFRAEYYFESSGIAGAPFGVVYLWPDTMSKPHTLLQYLKGEIDGKSRVKTDHPLEERLRIAKHIITAVLYVHSLGWLHKSIRSENVLLARSMIEKEGIVLGSAYLKGFDYSRRDDGLSTGFDETRDWKREIYHHPDRQQNPGAHGSIDGQFRYHKWHDLYSIGVILLELGLWRSLETQSALLEQASATKRRDILIDVASIKLPPLMGGRYARIVQACLKVNNDTALDENDLDGDFLCGVLNDLDDIHL